MSTILWDHSHQLEHSLSAVEGDWNLLAAKGSYWLLRLSLSASLVGLLSSVKALRKEVAVLPEKDEIDPNDVLIEKLLELQLRVRSLYHQIPASHHFSRWIVNQIHKETGLIRVYIMEHDADLSPISGSFTDAESLFSHLNSL
ncbi:hypothetical protein [Methylocaldum sp.]|uniref:hypothetical protein n=1 Tax=Methylocaldum sp. TaxID=1969727 RepID=UPI002D6CBDCE|nr:hypothetical protein [Methylocaldum sp.]HYE35666.1 hypothetical protein [Methylocaldum sp.]